MLLGAACESEPRVPYISPKLENWPQPYRGVAGLKLHAFTTGYLSMPEALLFRGGSLTRSRHVPVPAFVIEHPKQGLVLFGTGLDPSWAQETGSTGFGLLGPEPHAVAGGDLRSQMQQVGLQPAAVRWIVLSSLQRQHAGEVEAFPEARVVTATAEREALGQDGADLELVDDVLSWKYVDFDNAKPLATLPAAVDLFGDGSLVVLDVRGATPGTMALLVRLPRAPVLLAGELIVLREQLRFVVQPAAAANRAEWWDRAWRLKRFQDLVPELSVVPGYDLTPLEARVGRDVKVHAPPKVEVPQKPTPTKGPLERLLPRR